MGEYVFVGGCKALLNLHFAYITIWLYPLNNYQNSRLWVRVENETLQLQYQFPFPYPFPICLKPSILLRPLFCYINIFLGVVLYSVWIIYTISKELPASCLDLNLVWGLLVVRFLFFFLLVFTISMGKHIYRGRY